MKNLLQPLTKYQKLLAIVLVLCIALFPQVVQNKLILRAVVTIMIYCLLSLGNMVISGYCGLLHIGHAAFYGIGAYTSAILSSYYGVPFIYCFFAAGFLTALAGFLISLPCLRVHVDFLSLITLAFAQFFVAVCTNWMEVTRGPLGIKDIPFASLFGFEFNSQVRFYYLVLAILVIVYVLLNNLMKSKTGRAFIAVRDDEISAKTLGIDVNKYKVLAFVIGALLAGFAGSMMAHYIRFVGPSAFGVDTSLLIMQMCILGGLGSLPGAILGAAFFIIMPEIIRPLAIYRLGLGGVIMLLVMLIRPQGILGSQAFAGKGGILANRLKSHLPKTKLEQA